MRTLGEDLASKTKKASFGIAPGFTQQSRLSAGFLEELFARQAMFDGDLREEESALRVEANE